MESLKASCWKATSHPHTLASAILTPTFDHVDQRDCEQQRRERQRRPCDRHHRERAVAHADTYDYCRELR